MKKRKLKKWVRVVLIALILIGVAWLGDIIQQREIDKCVNAGHSYQYCVEGLY